MVGIEKIEFSNRKRGRWANEDLAKAVTEYRENAISLRSLSKKHGIPRTTLVYHIRNDSAEGRRKRTFSMYEEEFFGEWLKGLAANGVSIPVLQIGRVVEAILNEYGRESNFQGERRGRDWYMKFLNRHKDLKESTQELNKKKISRENVPDAAKLVELFKEFAELQNFDLQKTIEFQGEVVVVPIEESTQEIVMCSSSGKSDASYLSFVRACTPQSVQEVPSSDQTKKRDCPSTLSSHEDEFFAQWLKELAAANICTNANQVGYLIDTILGEHGRVSRFKGKRRGEEWYYAFLKRHPDLKVMIADINRHKHSSHDRKKFIISFREYAALHQFEFGTSEADYNVPKVHDVAEATMLPNFREYSALHQLDYGTSEAESNVPKVHVVADATMHPNVEEMSGDLPSFIHVFSQRENSVTEESCSADDPNDDKAESETETKFERKKNKLSKTPKKKSKQCGNKSSSRHTHCADEQSTSDNSNTTALALAYEGISKLEEYIKSDKLATFANHFREGHEIEEDGLFVAWKYLKLIETELTKSNSFGSQGTVTISTSALTNPTEISIPISSTTPIVVPSDSIALNIALNIDLPENTAIVKNADVRKHGNHGNDEATFTGDVLVSFRPKQQGGKECVGEPTKIVTDKRKQARKRRKSLTKNKKTNFKKRKEQVEDVGV